MFKRFHFYSPVLISAIAEIKIHGRFLKNKNYFSNYCKIINSFSFCLVFKGMLVCGKLRRTWMELATPEHLALRKQPKQARTRALLDKVVASTAALVQAQGYHAVNTNSIAKHAEIDVKSLYEFFPNKEAILYRMADEWLLSIRNICLKYEDETYAALPWPAFFQQLNDAIKQDLMYSDKFISLNGLWDLLPEFSKLDTFHQDFIRQFYLKHFKRFGCTAPLKQQKTVCTFLMAVEDGVGSMLEYLKPAERDALWQMQTETALFHLEKILPN
ncbi:MAG: AcrR family transcriptional regulator [Bermanella sp.]